MYTKTVRRIGRVPNSVRKQQPPSALTQHAARFASPLAPCLLSLGVRKQQPLERLDLRSSGLDLVAGVRRLIPLVVRHEFANRADRAGEHVEWIR